MLTRLLLSFPLLLMLSTGFALDKLPTNLQAGWNAISQATLKKEVSYLASDALAGRYALSAGDQQAIDWIAAEFKAAGLKPAAGESYLQAVKLIEFIPDENANYLALNGSKKWKTPEIYLAFPNNVNLSGDVVFAGYGITAPKLQYDDYANIDVKGKIVLIFEHEPQEKNPRSIFNGSSNTIYATPLVKSLIAQQHGAVAVLVAPEPNRDHPSNQERRARVGNVLAHLKSKPSQALADDALHIPVIVISDKVANAIAGKKISLSTLQTTIDKQLTPQSQVLPNTTLTIHNVNKLKREGTSYNVVGLLEGSDPALKKETIIISAHHDHDGKTGKVIKHGADDNASGTAGVVTLAHAIAKNSQSTQGVIPKRSILFVVFTSEERGLLGAFYMAHHPLRPLATTRAMINFDMIGRNESASAQTTGLINIPRNTANRLNLIGAHYSPDYARLIAEQNKYVGLLLDERFDNEYALNILFRSDQFPFILQKIPAFWWFTGFHPDYHQVTDTADKINYSKMQKILRLAYVASYAFADQSTYPAFMGN